MHLNVLHLDDDPLFLEQFAEHLKASNKVKFSVCSVDNETSYFQDLGRLNPEIVVLDIKLMGDRPGQQLAAETKKLAPMSVIFMCSDLRDPATIAACLQAGADDFFFKNLASEDVPLRLWGAYQLRLRAGKQRRDDGVKGAVGQTMDAIRQRIPRIVESAVTTVHVSGESGTGKEVVADLFAAHVPSGCPFVRVNCGAIPANLLESELFGHTRGAFTGAVADKAGLIEMAHGGWLFLDEVALLSGEAQVALLRVLENHVVRRLGGQKERKVSLKVLSATNVAMVDQVKEGRFRQDLWQRLCETTIHLPPLRERMLELPVLLRNFCRGMENGPYKISESARDVLTAYDWRAGNVRELRNCLRAMTETHVDKVLTPLGIPERIWQALAEQKPTSQGVPAPGPVNGSPLQLTWDLGQPYPPFELLTRHLLLALVKREFQCHGKLSVRSLAKRTAIPKSTLAIRLKELVQYDLISNSELSSYVSVGKIESL